MTEKLYETDSHTSEFDAVVLTCEEESGRCKVVLNRSCFFPEGGGQYADTGVLGGVNVLDVQEKGGEVYHYTDAPLTVGATVHGVLDYEKRFSRMQQHSAEHIVTGLIHGKYGYDNVGFHLADDICTLDMNGPLTREQMREVEAQANRVVFENIPVEILFPTKEELKTLEYRSKIEIEGQVRIVRIPGVDICACCAPHVERTGEIGLIRVVDTQNYKGGVRITILCGDRALRDAVAKEAVVKELMTMFSAKQELVVDSVKRLQDEKTALEAKLMAANRKLLLTRAGEVPEGEKAVCIFDRELEGSLPRELMNMVLDQNVTVCGVFTGDGENYRYVIGSRSENLRDACKLLNEKFNGRGGGKPEMVQGSLAGTEEAIRTAFAELLG